MFDRYVSGSKPSWKRRAVLMASLGAHGVLGIGLLVAGLLHVTEISPPALAIVFVSAHEPPAQATKVPPQRRQQQQAKRTAAAASARPLVQPTSPMVQPTPTPEVAPSDNSGPPDVGPGGGGDPGGRDGSGGPGGGDEPGGPGVGVGPPRARNVAPHQLDAQKIAGADPHLPEFVKLARRGLGDNAFAARICVDQAGSVSRVDVLSGIPGADEAIVAALRQWRYRTQPIPVCFVSRFVFDVQ